MVLPDQFVANLVLANNARELSGAIVECGTWRGGMIGGIAKLLGARRTYFLFDSFEGLPPAEAIDGTDALRWQKNPKGSKFYDNCTASYEDAKHAMNLAGIGDAVIVKGWFEDTLPTTTIDDGIAILRMDADWYSSTMQILEALFPQVVPGGCILIDDYYTWEGCAKAVHDFLSRHQRPERLRSYKGVCYIIKESVSENLND